MIGMNKENRNSKASDIQTILENISQVKVDELQAFFDKERKADVDELVFSSKGLIVLNKLIETGHITLSVQSKENPGFHHFWSSMNHSLNDDYRTFRLSRKINN